MMKIVSGGQTGVDRAALDVALELGLEIGGWCPRGRWAEDGPIPHSYPLSETRAKDAHVRTQRNVECSTATLILSRGSPMGGARLTADLAESMRRPVLVVDLTDDTKDPVDIVVDWVSSVKPRVLNVAGPRESSAPGITEQTKTLLRLAFELALPELGDQTQDDLQSSDLPKMHLMSFEEASSAPSLSAS